MLDEAVRRVAFKRYDIRSVEKKKTRMQRWLSEETRLNATLSARVAFWLCRYHMLLFYPVKSLTVAMAATSASIMLAQVLSAPLAATLMSLHGAAGLRGWQWIAIVEGAATVAVGALLYATLPRAPADVKALSADEVAWVQSRVSKHVPRGSCCALASFTLQTSQGFSDA